MTSTTVQLDPSCIDIPTSLEHEIFLLSPALSQSEPAFHDAAEDLPETKPSILDRLPASFQELYISC